MASYHGIPFNGGMDAPSGSGSQHIVETCQALADAVNDNAGNPLFLTLTGGSMAGSIEMSVFSLDYDHGSLLNLGTTLLLTNDDGPIELQSATLTAVSIADDGAGHSTIGFYGVSAVVQPTGGALTAGGLYGANEQLMLNSLWTALQDLGLIS